MLTGEATLVDQRVMVLIAKGSYQIVFQHGVRISAAHVVLDVELTFLELKCRVGTRHHAEVVLFAAE